MLITPDLAKFGRSNELHFALFGIHSFAKSNNRYPERADADAVWDLATSVAKQHNYEAEVNRDIFNLAVSYTKCGISPTAAFFGGIIAQEIVKFTGKYSPLKQWLHFDIFETVPKDA
jgi:ubiquitin-activating enzyme E1